jgi:hypothetical protein
VAGDFVELHELFVAFRLGGYAAHKFVRHDVLEVVYHDDVFFDFRQDTIDGLSSCLLKAVSV